MCHLVGETRTGSDVTATGERWGEGGVVGEKRKEMEEQSKSTAAAEPGEERRPPTDRFRVDKKRKCERGTKSASPLLRERGGDADATARRQLARGHPAKSRGGGTTMSICGGWKVEKENWADESAS